MKLRIAIAVVGLGAVARAAVPLPEGLEVKPRKQEGPAAILLTTQKITAKPGDRLEKLLTEHGVYADGEALGLVYTLNPDVKSQKLAAHQKLILPVAQQGGESCAPACLVAVTRDRDRKKSLHETSDALAELQAKLGSQESHSDPVKAPPGLGKSAASISSSVRAIDLAVRERARPLDPELVRQTSDDAALVRGWLDKVARGEVKPSAAQVSSLDAYAVELAARAAQLDEKMSVDASDRWADVELTVRLLGAQSSALRIYYATEIQFFFKDEARYSAFSQLTAPFVRTLPEGNYRVWAGDPDQPSADRARTDVLKVQLSRRTPPLVELRVK